MSGNSKIDKLELIYNKYKNLMHHIANSVLRDYHLSEDAVNQALFKIYGSIDSIAEFDSVQTKNFVSVVTKRVSIDIYRKQVKTNVLSLDELSADTISSAIPFNIDNNESFIDNLSKLPAEHIKVLILKYEKGYSNKEIAAMLQYSEAKTAKLITRAKNKLSDLLCEI